MSRTIADLTEGTGIYIDEQGTEAVEHIPYIYLGLDDYGNARVLRKYAYINRRMHSEGVAAYNGCEMDVWLEDEAEGFLSRLDAATRNCLVNTTIAYADFTEDEAGAIMTIARRCFLLSGTEVGFTTSGDEGRSFLPALKTYYNTTDDNTARIPRTANESTVAVWMRTPLNATSFRTIYIGGQLSSHAATWTGDYARPALSISPTTLVSDEGAEQILLLPSGTTTSWGIRATMSLGQSTDRPKRCKLYVPADDFDTAQYWVCNNFLDTNPTWVPCANGGVAVFGTTKTAAIWELGVKVEARSGAINKTIGEPVMAVDYGSSGDEKPVLSEKDVNFYDYDGTVVASYTASDFANLTAMPGNPSHSGLVAQGWNWSLADAKTYVAKCGRLNVGQMYITKSGDTEMDVHFEPERLSPILSFCVDGSVTVDWGDNTTPDAVTGTSLTTRLDVPHTYATAGDYTIKIHVESGEFQFHTSFTYQLLRKNTKPDQNRVYTGAIKCVRFGNGVTSIGNYAFYYCAVMSYVTIPNGVTSIGSNAFGKCNELSEITLPYGVVSVGGNAFADCYSLSKVSMPTGVTSLGDSVFQNCVLPRISIPNNVPSIGKYAFSSCCRLANVTIPESVTSIKSNAFNSCGGLAEVHLLSATPPTLTSTASDCFNGVSSDCVFYIPAGSLSAYQSATNWSTFADRMVEE